jgi:DNA polymerase III delta prime subunit
MSQILLSTSSEQREVNLSSVTNLLWVEKYRPSTLSDCILPNDLSIIFNGMVKEGKIPNMLFYGKAGTGKTTVARALAKDIDMDSMLINCSEDKGIDTLRVKIRQYASTISLTGKGKLIILDEFDYATTAIQTGLRGAIEEFANNCRFVLTCNYKNRVIDPLHSRCTGIDFSIPADEKANIATQILSRVEYILKQENVPYEIPVLANLIKKHFPDIRRIINELQKYSSYEKIDVGILSQGSCDSYKELLGYMKKKDFAACRKWVMQNIDLNTSEFFKRLYNELYVALKPASVPQAILIIAEYQYKSAFASDQEINTMAMVVQLMMDCEFA